MKTLKAVGVGLMVVGLMIAVPLAAIAINLTAGQDHNDMMPNLSSSTGMGSMSMSGTQAGSAADQLTIVHVQKGCHVWSNGNQQMPMMRLSLKPGQMLRIMNQDIDMHRMVELSGPATMALGGPMKQGTADSLTFTKPGVYRFGTKSSAMKGMPEAPTIGPDNMLRLTVTVS